MELYKQVYNLLYSTLINYLHNKPILKLITIMIAL